MRVLICKRLFDKAFFNEYSRKKRKILLIINSIKVSILFLNKWVKD